MILKNTRGNANENLKNEKLYSNKIYFNIDLFYFFVFVFFSLFNKILIINLINIYHSLSNIVNNRLELTMDNYNKYEMHITHYKNTKYPSE